MNVLRIVLMVILSAVVSSCGWLPVSKEGAEVYETGVSPAGSRQAVWMATYRPGLSAVGKDYLFVGPMTVNRDGMQRSYLWFAIGTTIDRRLIGAPARSHEEVVLVIDGTLMTFDLVDWDNAEESTPYAQSIDSYASYAARITRSQLRQIASATLLQAYVTDSNGRSPIYRVVQGDPRGWLNPVQNLAAADR